MKEFLSRNGRTFTVRNVDEDEAAYRELVSKGWMTVPVTVIGRTVIFGFKPKELKEALESHGDAVP